MKLSAMKIERLRPGAGRFEAGAAAGTVADTLNRPSQDALSQAQARLSAQLLNRNNITNAAQLSTGIESRVLGDTSKDPAKQTDEVAAAYDRATESIQK
jgi:hypothetical protein